jgi:hypothetical protein
MLLSSLIGRTIVFHNGFEKIPIFDGSRADDRGLETSANPGSFPGVASDAPSVSGATFHQYSELDVPLSDYGLCSPICNLSFVISKAIGYGNRAPPQKMKTVTSLKTTESNLRGLIDAALEQSGGLLRLAPCWVPRSFLQPGRRLKLHPDDVYAYGLGRGGIDERWFASTTPAANENRTPDEGWPATYRGNDLEKISSLAGILEIFR